MPNFKPKNIKKMVVSKNITTLDGKHKELIDSFNADKLELLPALLAEKTVIVQKIKNNNANIDDINIDELLEMSDRLADIKNKIRLIKKKEKDYLLNNSSYIFDYFETKKKIVDCENKTTSLDNFFKINKNVDTAAHSEDLTNERKNIQSYMRNVDEKYLDITKFIVATDICRVCNKGEMIAVDYEGIMICNVCSNSVKYLVENEKPSYKEPPKEVCFYAYKRINHFREILAQFQAKETTQIPDEVIENIIQQIKKERIDLSHMTNRRTKEILKKLGYNKYYEHIPFIKDKLGIKPPIMSSELENTLCNLFMDIQGPYAKFCPDDRVNFLNYYYTVYKLCELLNQLHFLPYFPMLKDREKRIEQDEIWKNICEELGWEYIPTI
jgi:hypothetical protein